MRLMTPFQRLGDGIRIHLASRSERVALQVPTYLHAYETSEGWSLQTTRERAESPSALDFSKGENVSDVQTPLYHCRCIHAHYSEFRSGI